MNQINKMTDEKRKIMKIFIIIIQTIVKKILKIIIIITQIAVKII